MILRPLLYYLLGLQWTGRILYDDRFWKSFEGFSFKERAKIAWDFAWIFSITWVYLIELNPICPNSSDSSIQWTSFYKYTVKNRTLYRVDISMSDCSNSWQLFGESWNITFLLIKCDISTFHKQLATIWTIGHRYVTRVTRK